MKRGYGDIPADLAQRGDCAGAKRKLAAMRPGLAQDYEAERVGKACGRSALAGMPARQRRCGKINARALAKGTRIEKKEHRLGVKMARRIARDHLCENPRYYSKQKVR